MKGKTADDGGVPTMRVRLTANERVAALMIEGFAVLDQGDFKRALQVGRALKRLRHSSAFEILALAYRLDGNVAKAAAVLKDGISKAGGVWVLWKLLADCYSDQGEFSKAEKLYMQALRCEHHDSSLVHLNRAIAFNRAGKNEQASKALARVKSERLARRAMACRIRGQLARGQRMAAHRTAERLSRIQAAPDEHYDTGNAAEILLATALGLAATAPNSRRALHFALAAVECDRGNAEALALIRAICARDRRCKTSFRIIIDGIWHGPISKGEAAPGFFRTFDVVAPDQRLAFKYLKPFFPLAVRKSLKIDEVEETALAKQMKEGVHFASAYHFYPSNERK